MQLYLDFDGTLIDSRPRQYRLFCDLAPTCPLSFQQYWEIKRQRVNQREMLQRYCGYTDEAATKAFHQAWMQEIESPARLEEDAPLPKVDAFLHHAATQHTLILVTARQNAAHVEAQLKRYGWRDLFAHVLVTQQRDSKEALIRTHVPPEPSAMIVGDTGEDIKTGKALGLTTVAVSSGVLSAEILKQYAPNQLLASIAELILPE